MSNLSASAQSFVPNGDGMNPQQHAASGKGGRGGRGKGKGKGDGSMEGDKGGKGGGRGGRGGRGGPPRNIVRATADADALLAQQAAGLTLDANDASGTSRMSKSMREDLGIPAEAPKPVAYTAAWVAKQTAARNGASATVDISDGQPPYAENYAASQRPPPSDNFPSLQDAKRMPKAASTAPIPPRQPPQSGASADAASAWTARAKALGAPPSNGPRGWATAGSNAAAGPPLNSPSPSATPTGGSLGGAGGGVPAADAPAKQSSAEALRAAEATGRRYSQLTLEELYKESLLQEGPSSRARSFQTFELLETVKGRRLNSLQGLALHRDVLTPAEQAQTLHYVNRLKDLGDDGALLGRTYSAPRKWMKGKGRVTVQLGCCYNYARDKNGNPPGILPKEPVCGLPLFFNQVIDKMIARGIFTSETRPDTCIVNFYTEGDCIPPHIDHLDFTRPFVTLSLLSEQAILFGANIKIVDEGEFAAPFSCPLPLGSVLVLDGNGANVAKHCVPSVKSDRVSITFRRIDHRKIKMAAFEGPDGTQQGQLPASQPTSWR